MKKIIYILLPLMTIIFSGCGTTQMQLNSTMTRTIVLDPIKKDQKIVYLRVSNTAMSKINLLPALLKEFKKRDVKVTNDPNKAKYLLDVNVLFANSLREAHAIKAATATGASTGIVAGVGSGSVKNGIVAGVIAAVIAGGIGRATEDEIYRAVIDISVKEVKKGRVKTSQYIQQKTRIFVSAVQMGLKLTKAIPILEKRAAYQIAEIFR